VLKLGVAINDVYQTIQAFMGGLFINYFNDFGVLAGYVEPKLLTGRNLANLDSSTCATTEGKWCRLPRSRSLNRVPARIYDAL